MPEKITEFYDEMSSQYSDRRYPSKTINYPQYLFKKRRDLFLAFLEKIEKDLPAEATVLEIGCADGVILKAIEEKFPDRFTRLVGVDISPKMIQEAKEQNHNARASFCLRDELPQGRFDIVIEFGVHPFDLNGELTYVSDRLNPSGHFFYDVVGARSLFCRIKLRDKVYVQNYKKYKIYESFFKKFFFIKESRVYGLFIPKLWAIPAIGLLIQPLIDSVFQWLISELYHEKIYVLKKLT